MGAIDRSKRMLVIDCARRKALSTRVLAQSDRDDVVCERNLGNEGYVGLDEPVSVDSSRKRMDAHGSN